MLGVEGMDPDGVAQFGETIGQGTDGGDFSRLHAGMNQGFHPRISPALRNLIQIVIKVAEDAVAVRIHKANSPNPGRSCSGSGGAKGWLDAHRR
jgi:hypothetical protein